MSCSHKRDPNDERGCVFCGTAPAAPMQHRLVVIESPFGTNPDGTRADAATLARNNEYLDACMRDSFSRGEAPYASHGIYPRVFDDATPSERRAGMEAGFAWGEKAGLRAVYVDHGITPGMREGIDRARHVLGQRVTVRLLSRPGEDFTIYTVLRDVNGKVEVVR
jgi:hypothetical protein